MTHIQQRRDTFAAWTLANPVLMDGEAGHEKDTGRWKLGDGVTAYIDLPYKTGVQSVAGRTGAPDPPFLRRPAASLGSRAGCNRDANIREPTDSRRSLGVACASRNARRTFPDCLPIQKRAASRGDQPDRPRRGTERPGRNVKCLPFLFRCLRTERQPHDVRLHGSHRSVPQVDRLSVAPAQRSNDLEQHLRVDLSVSTLQLKRVRLSGSPLKGGQHGIVSVANSRVLASILHGPIDAAAGMAALTFAIAPARGLPMQESRRAR